MSAQPITTESPDRRPCNTEGRATLLFWGLLCLLGTVVALVHRPVLSARAECFDDEVYLREVYLIQDPGWAAVKRAFSEILTPSVPGYYEPLSMVSLTIDYARGGRPDNYRPFHVTSLALHVANTVMVAVLLRMLFSGPYVAVIVALLFGLHPITVESIALVAQRKAVLAPFFSLASMILYVAYARAGAEPFPCEGAVAARPPRGRAARWGLLAGSVVLYAFALLSKPTSTPLPVLLLLLDYWPLRRLSRRALLEKIPFFVVGAASAVITVVATSQTAGITLPGRDSPARIPLQIGYLLSFYVYKILWPARLTSVYPLPEPFTMANGAVAAAVVCTCVLFAVPVLLSRRTRAPLTGWLFFVIAIFPVLGVIGYTWVTASDKYVYLPAVGLLLPLAWGANLVWRGGSRAGMRRGGLVAVAALAAGAEAVATQRYLSYWQDTERLYTRMIKLAPNSPYAYNNLAVFYAQQGRFEDAVRRYEDALRVGPPSAQTRTNLAAALGQLGRTDKAIVHLNEAIRIDPGYADAHNILGNVLLVQDRIDDAIRHYTLALEAAPDLYEARNNLALAWLRKGRVDDAVRELRLCLRIQPLHTNARCLLAEILASQGRIAEAIAEYERVLRDEPQHSRARERLDALRPRR